MDLGRIVSCFTADPFSRVLRVEDQRAAVFPKTCRAESLESPRLVESSHTRITNQGR